MKLIGETVLSTKLALTAALIENQWEGDIACLRQASP